MLKWFTQSVKNLALARQSRNTGPYVIPRHSHNISRRHISRNALKVLYRLQEHDYESYLVGGGVRDLLLEKRPKDFDIATAATPEQVNALFKNSRIIGRRFRLIHVQFGREIIEVATFRADHSQSQHKNNAARSENGMLLRDNVYGNVEEDARRRDFTINAMYYSLDQFAVHDFANGLRDLNAQLIRMIGDPQLRYPEDPVRMLRAVRFAAKLEFTIEAKTAAPIADFAKLLKDVPAARLFDEVLKLFMSGHGVASFEQLLQHQLFAPLFPATASHLNEQANNTTGRFIELGLESTDNRIAADKPVTPAFIFAILLWQPLLQQQQKQLQQGMHPAPALHAASSKVLQQQVKSTAIPRRFSTTIREIWDLQARLERHQPRRVSELLEHKRFRAAYDFLVLRAKSGENVESAAQWWTEYQDSDTEQRQDMLKHAKPRNPKRRRRSSKPKPAA